MTSPPTIELEPKAPPKRRYHIVTDNAPMHSPSALLGVGGWLGRQAEIALETGCTDLAVWTPEGGYGVKYGYIRLANFDLAERQYRGSMGYGEVAQGVNNALATSLGRTFYMGTLLGTSERPMDAAIRWMKSWRHLSDLCDMKNVTVILDRGGKITPRSQDIALWQEEHDAYTMLFEAGAIHGGELVIHHGHPALLNPDWAIFTAGPTSDDNTTGYAHPLEQHPGPKVLFTKEDINAAYAQSEDNMGLTGGQWIRSFLGRDLDGIGANMRDWVRRGDTWDKAIELVQSDERYAANAAVEAGGVG